MGDEQVRVWVGAFGKHPGWDDHIADQGLETDLLTRVKRLLYLEGIGGNIDSGTWDGLDADERLDGFDHVLLWRWPGGLVVGRLWSSSDGKGRTRYPMIVCAHCRGLAGSWVAGPCLEAIEALASRCRSATDAAGVITAVDDARRSLRAASASAPSASREPLPPPAAIVELAGDGALGKKGLERVLYQIEREFSSFLALDEESGTRTRTIDVRPRHMRVPACRASAGEACDLWLRFLLERVGESVPLVAVVRRGESFCDIIAGEPTRSQFSCFQSSLERMPLTTEIPYTIDDAFDGRVRARVDAGRSGELRDIDPGRITEQAVRRRPAPPDRSQLKLIGIVAAAVVVVVLLIVAAVNIIGSGGVASDGPGPTPDRVEETGGGSAEPLAVPEAEAAARREAFLEWCRAYAGWFGPLTAVKGEDRAVLEADPHLAARVLGPLDEAHRGGVVLNPLHAVSNPPPRVGALLESPPAEVVEAPVWDRTRAALSVIEAVEDGLASWPPRANAAALADRLEGAGAANAAAELRSAAEAVGPGGTGSVIEAAAALTRVESEGLSEIAEQVGAIERAVDGMRASNDAVLAAEAEWFEALLGRVRAAEDLATLAGHMNELRDSATLAGSLSAFITDGLGDVDPEVFALTSRAHAGGSTGADRLRLWLAEAGRPEMQKLDPRLDPRPAADIGARLARVDEAIHAIEAGGRSEVAAEAGALVERRDALGDKAAVLSGLAWNTQTRTDIERRTRSLTHEIAALSSSVQDLHSAISENVAEKLSELRSRESISTTELAPIDEIWRSGRDALVARFENDGNDLALFRDAQVLSRSLQEIEAATLSESGGVEGRPTWNLERIQDLRDAARASAVREHADDLARGTVDEASARDAASAVRARLGAAEESLAELIEAVDAIETHLNGLYGMEEPWADGGTIRSRVSGLGPNLADAEAIAPRVFEEVAALDRASSADWAALSEMAGNPTLPGAAMVEVWRSLSDVNPAWPGGAEALERDLDLAQRVRTAIRGLEDAERSARLSAAVDEAQRKRWAVATSASDDWDELRACRRLSEACGGRVEDLGGAARFNLGVLAMEEAIDPAADDDANRAAVNGVLGFMGEPAADSTAGLWLAGVREIVSEAGEAAPPLDPSAVGPATAGWSVVEGVGEERLVYELPGRMPQRLAFRLLTTPEGGAVYLCETELTVGVVAELTRSDAVFAGHLLHTLTWIDAQQDSRHGMVTWEWAGTAADPELVAASSWVPATQVAVDSYFVEGAVQYPTEAHPIQRLALSDAMFIAARLGCRLPTEAEWKAALAVLGPTDMDAGWNLRDQAFGRQVAHLEASATRGPVVMPDGEAHQGLAGEPSFPFDDGSVWLEEADGGPEAAFKHLIGNLHEFVILDVGEQPEAVGPRSVAPQDETATRWYPIAGGVHAGVIGGSVFGRSGVPVEASTPVKDESGGWSDVGLRLAFSPGAGRVRVSVATRIRSALAEAPFLQGE